jgi:hypothetical protein
VWKASKFFSSISACRDMYSILQKIRTAFFFVCFKPPIHILGNCVLLLIEFLGTRKKQSWEERNPFGEGGLLQNKKI